MITFEPIEGRAFAIRCIDDTDSGKNPPPFVASGILEFEGDSKVAWVKALSKNSITGMSHKLVKEMVVKIHEQGVDYIKAHRIDAHGLPFVAIGSNGEYILDVVALAKRFKR